MEDPPVDCEQMMWIRDCAAVTIDGCVLVGDKDDFEEGPPLGIYLIACAFARCSNNVIEGFSTAIISFNEDCLDAVEFGNRDVNAGSGPSRTTIDSVRLVSMSRRALGIPTVDTYPNLPSASLYPAGSMIWVISPTSPHKIQISDGSSWVDI